MEVARTEEARIERFEEARIDALLEGRLAPLGDDPLAPVADLLEAARAGIGRGVAPPPAQLGALAAAAVAGPSVGGRLARGAVRALVVAGVLGLGTTAAAAANGSLPGPVQDVAHDLAGVVGIELPEGSQDGPGHGRSDEAPGRPASPGQRDDPSRADEAPGAPDGVGTGQGTGRDVPAQDGGNGVGTDEVPPGLGGTIPEPAEEVGPENEVTTPPSNPNGGGNQGGGNQGGGNQGGADRGDDGEDD